MCFDFQPLYPPTQRAKKINERLYILLYCQIAFAILQFAATDFIDGITELILCLILWCGVKQMQFCQILMYIIICLISWVQNFIFIGNIVQHNLFSELDNYQNVAIFAVQWIGLVFYLVAICLAFQGYREYKAIQYQSIGGGVMSMFRQQQQQGGRGRDNSVNSNQNRGNGRGEYAPQGQYQPPPYQEQNQNQNQNQNSNGSRGAGTGFQAFQGRGVRLG